MSPPEGGGKHPPFQESFFERIVNVNWAPPGDVGFVAGDNGSGVTFFSMDREKIRGAESGAKYRQSSPSIPSMTGERSGSVWAAAAHKFDNQGVFLLGGSSSWDAFSQPDGFIATSTDGVSWREVFRLPNEPAGPYGSWAEIMGLVWNDDDQEFYACGHITIQPPLTDPPDPEADASFLTEVDLLISSKDGFGWSIVERSRFRYKDWTYLGAITAKCNPKAPLDMFGKPLPDGWFGYQKTKDKEVLVVPDKVPVFDYGQGVMQYFKYPGQDTVFDSEIGPATTLKIEITEAGKTISKSSSPPIPCYACAYSDDIIVAAGGPVPTTADVQMPDQFAISFDMGDSWEVTSSAGQPPAAPIAGARMKKTSK